MRTHLLVLTAAAGLLVGCPNPNTYGTPRTIEPGRISHTAAVEGWGATGTASNGATVGGFIPTFPTYQLRVGVADAVDIGGRIANLSSLGADVKINPVRGKFDLAIDPAFQWFTISTSAGTTSGNSASSSLKVFYLHLPLLLGFNLSDSFSIVLSPGVMWSVVNGTSSSGTDKSTDAAATTKGAFARFGLGLDVRITRGFALHPEVTALRNLQGDEGKVTIYMIGLGFNFGALPDFSDVH